MITTLCPELKDLGSEKDFMGARIMVKSRVFGVEVNKKETLAMVPVADMLNHEDEEKC